MLTQDQIENIINLWTQGLTGTEIANLLSLTRNTVLGTVHRLRMKGLALEERKGMTGFKVKKPRPLIIKKPKKAIRKAAKKIICEPIVENNKTPIGLLDLRYNSCRFIVEQGNVETTKYCNAEISRSSYCAEHYNLCYVPSRKDSIDLRIIKN